MTLTGNSLSMYLQSHACRGRWWRPWRKGAYRLSAFWTVLSLLTLLAVSGPHLVHHLTEQHPQPAHHSHDVPTPPSPDCPILFLMQHTPVAAEAAAFLSTPLPAAELLAFVPPHRVSEAPTYALQARAPPDVLL